MFNNWFIRLELTDLGIEGWGARISCLYPGVGPEPEPGPGLEGEEEEEDLGGQGPPGPPYCGP